MRIRIMALCLTLCLLLSGCGSWMDGSYSSVKPHTERQNQTGGEAIAVADYNQLRQAMAELVESGSETMLINVAQMDQDSVTQNMDRAILHILEMNPIGAYAVESIAYEQGTSGGQPALAVTVRYNQNRAELRSLKEAAGMAEAQEIVSNALSQCESKVVMRVSQYRTLDFEQYVRDYMEEYPQTVMEMPQLTVSTFPETGTQRVVEIVFAYQTGRDDLKTMQTRVRPLFTSAELYVSGNSADYDQYSLLYAFLMERHEYQFETSITPAYSLLVHGVGDSRAFATVYAAMCRRVGLECRVVSGTCNGESQFWNIICVDGVYHHLDLVNCSQNGAFHVWGDEEMSGYVWDYSAYPECGVYVDPATLTEPTEDTEPTDPTDPEETSPVETGPGEPPAEGTTPETEATTEPTEVPETTVPETEPTEEPTEPVPTEPPTDPPEETEPEPTDDTTVPEETE